MPTSKAEATHTSENNTNGNPTTTSLHPDSAAEAAVASRKRPRLSHGITGAGESVAGGGEKTNNISNTTTINNTMVSLPPPMDQHSLHQELGRIETENRKRRLLEEQQQQQQQQQQEYKAKGFTNKGPPRKKPTPKRTLPPHLIVLYQELKDNACNVAQNTVEQQDAQRMLAEAQRRLERSTHRAAVIDQEKKSLDQQVFEAELQLDNDFTRHYRQLVMFQQEFGHCNVSSSTNNSGQYKLLSAWAKKIRRVKQMRASNKGVYYQGTQWQYYIRALDRLGFVWDAVKDQWRNQFEKMLAFKVATGHCCVPKAHASDKPLGAWVHRQRYHYKLFHTGKPTQLTPERIDLLNSVGFSWAGDCATRVDMSAMPRPTRPRKGKVQRTAEEEWEHHYQQLVKFKCKHGHVRISAIDDKNRDNQLRDWVAWQRREFKRWKKGDPSHVTSEHVKRLSDIGFDWQVAGSRKGAIGNTMNMAKSNATGLGNHMYGADSVSLYHPPPPVDMYL